MTTEYAGRHLNVSMLNAAWDKNPRQIGVGSWNLLEMLTTFRDGTHIALRLARNVALLERGIRDGRLGENLRKLGREAAIDLERKYQKNRLEAWIPASYGGDGTRRSANVREVSCLVLDIEDGTTFEKARDLWPYCRAVHTSWSHTEISPRLRLVLPLARPVPAEHWKKAWKSMYVQAVKAGITADIKCSDPTRLYFLPYRRSGVPFRGQRVEGPLLDIAWEQIPDPAPIEHRFVVSRHGSLLNPGERRALAVRLGADTDQERAFHIKCPGCGRYDVYFFFEPRQMVGARCNHERSCSWRGSLRDLEVG